MTNLFAANIWFANNVASAVLSKVTQSLVEYQRGDWQVMTRYNKQSAQRISPHYILVIDFKVKQLVISGVGIYVTAG